MKEFVMVPLAGIRMHFVSLDTSALYGLLRDIGDVQPGYEAFEELADEHWGSTFRISKLLGGGSKAFTRLMETDGVSICLHQTRPKNASELLEKHARNKKKKPITPVALQGGADRVIGLDPGKRTIYHCAELLGDGTFRSLEFSSARYQRESGMVQERRRSLKWNKEVRGELRALSVVSPKGLELPKLNAYLKVYHAHKAALWTEYTRAHWARQRLRLYGGKKRSFASFFNDMVRDPVSPEVPRRVVVGYGNASFDPGNMKRKQSVPTTRAYRECASRFLTASVDEFRTSRMEWETGRTLEVVGCRTERGAKAVRGLLWCSSTNQTTGKFINRDLNAAINIRRCLVLPQRPPELCRREGLAALEKRITRWIRC